MYAVSSVRSISGQVTDGLLAGRGFSAEQQLRAFIDAAHMLRKSIGFDLEPHVAQFAVTVLEDPDLFRWIKLSEVDRDELDYGLTYDVMLGAEWQCRLAQEVRQIVRRHLSHLGLAVLEAQESDSAEFIQLKLQAIHGLTCVLIDRGYWTVPLHHWEGVGVPAFRDYDLPSCFPQFRYLTRDGQDVSDRTYGVLTPFAFYSGLQANRAPVAAPPRNERTIAFYEQIFPWWRDRFGFDFVRYDYAGHLSEAARPENPDFPTSDRPTPYILLRSIRAAKSPDKPYVGAFAENLGDDLEPYAEVGFDVTLGTNVLDRVDRAHIEKCFSLYDRLSLYNLSSPSPFAITYAIDTHDTGEPSLRGASAQASRFDRRPVPTVRGPFHQLRASAPTQVRGDGVAGHVVWANRGECPSDESDMGRRRGA